MRHRDNATLRPESRTIALLRWQDFGDDGSRPSVRATALAVCGCPGSASRRGDRLVDQSNRPSVESLMGSESSANTAARPPTLRMAVSTCGSTRPPVRKSGGKRLGAVPVIQ